MRELKFWTSLDTVVFYGNKEARGVLLKHEFTPGARPEGGGGGRGKKASKRGPPVPKFDVCITTYEMLTANPEAFKPVQVTVRLELTQLVPAAHQLVPAAHPLEFDSHRSVGLHDC